MAEHDSKPYSDRLKEMMAEKSRLLSKAHTLAEMGMPETAQALWASAANCEERIAPLLEVIGRDGEAALHRVSAATCYEKAGEMSRAANLYRAALAGPLSVSGRTDVERKLGGCLERLQKDMVGSVA